MLNSDSGEDARRKVSLRTSSNYSYLFLFSPLGFLAELMKGRIGERVFEVRTLSQRTVFV